MTPAEVVAAIESAGGNIVLSADGERVRCKLPRVNEHLVDEVRGQREGILRLLQQGVEQDCTTEQTGDPLAWVGDGADGPSMQQLIRQWLLERCVSSTRCSCNPHILHREFSQWANFELDAGTEDGFVESLQTLGFPLDASGMVTGLALDADFIAARVYEFEKSLPEEDRRNLSKGGIAMPLIISSKQKQFEIPDEGEHLAVIADIKDLGEVQTQFGAKLKVLFTWLVEQRDKDGKQIVVFNRFTQSGHPKSTLAKTIKAITGKEPGESFDVETLIGTNARLVIQHQPHEDRTYANIAAILRPRKGDELLKVPPDFKRSNGKNGNGAHGNGPTGDETDNDD